MIFLAAVRRSRGNMEAGRLVRRVLQRLRWKTIVTRARMTIDEEGRHSQMLDIYES